MDSNIKLELIKWGIPIICAYLGKVVGKFFATRKELKKYQKYLPRTLEIVQSAAVLCAASNNDKKSKAVEILQKELGISTSGANYLVETAYVIYKDKIAKK